MVTMHWNKDAAGRLTAAWQGGTEIKTSKAACRYHKAVRAEFSTRVLEKPHLRKTWH